VDQLLFSPFQQGPLSRAISTVDNFGLLPAPGFRPRVTVTGPLAGPVDGPETKLLGPGDVSGLSPGAVVRTDPSGGADDVEANQLAAVELRPVELPWTLTPAAPAGTRLRPWLALVVLDADTAPLQPGEPLPVVDAEIAQLPDLRDSWGWAHIQRTAGTGMLPGGGPAPDGEVARLMCPRRLAPGVRYRACLVPAFASGVAAGLGDPAASGRPHDLAWQAGAPGSVRLPVYHQWTFTTGSDGGFRDLVRRLAPADPEQLRRNSARLVDLRHPWPGDRPLSGTPQIAAVQGVLRPFADPPVPGENRLTEEVAKKLPSELHDLLGAGNRATLAPPLYGGRHVLADNTDSGPGWLAVLNLSVTNRIAAGLGAAYVRANQEDLMARAWEQVGAIREANRLRAVTELTTAIATKVHERHVATLDPAELVAFAAPARVRTRLAPDTTMATTVTISRLPDDAATPAFTRRVRPGGKLARRTGVTVRSVLPRALLGEAAVPGATPVVPEMPTHPEVAPSVVSAVATRQEVVRGAMNRVASVLNSGAADGMGLPVESAALAAHVGDVLHPGDTHERRLATRVGIPDRFQADAAAKVMACPEFPVPTALALLASDPDWFVPGMAALPANKVALLQPNPVFIESFLVGANHEMMRELLWREYPTDQRGTPFSRFWPSVSGGPEITQLHLWTDQAPLGGHLIHGEGPVVLLVRGEVLRRYPGTSVTALRGVPDGDGRFRPDFEQSPVMPVFAVKVDEETSVYAFPIPAEELTTPEGAAAWFFVFAEHSFRIRFGFAENAPGPLASWADAAWPPPGGQADGCVPVERGHAVAGVPFPGPPGNLALEDPQWTKDGADIARIAVQRPFRVAIQARALLHGGGA
jgi:hypothetical protein